MTIALDYDGTYTRDPALWSALCINARSKGHCVIIATMRNRQEKLDPYVSGYVDWIYYTEGKPKKKFLGDCGIHVDVWIDDQPGLI